MFNASQYQSPLFSSLKKDHLNTVVTSLTDWISTTFSTDGGSPRGRRRKTGRLWANGGVGGGGQWLLDFDPIMVIPQWMTLWSDSVYPHSIDFLCCARRSHTETHLLPHESHLLEYDTCSWRVGINIITSPLLWHPAGCPGALPFHFHFALMLIAMTQRSESTY